jgi:uroporphyrin-III C-methyltransferase / precorrin-2 dehydrogenase / sirohydrochlorin ferrochelatase
MIANLPLFHCIAGQPVIVLGAGEAAAAKARLVERAGGLVTADMQEGIDKGARLAFVAFEDPQITESYCIRLRCAGLLVNVPDRPELCDFTVPSILDRSPVLLAIGTGGASAGLAKALRMRLEQILPQKLGTLASALSTARSQMRSRWPDAATRRRALDAALSEGGVLDLLKESSANQIDDWLYGQGLGASSGLVEIRLTSDDPEDLTLRQARLLSSADVVAYESDVPSVVLNRARADAVRVELDLRKTLKDYAGTVVVLLTSSSREAGIGG